MNTKLHRPSHKPMGLAQYRKGPTVRAYGPYGQLETHACACGCTGSFTGREGGGLAAYRAAQEAPEHSTSNRVPRGTP